MEIERINENTVKFFISYVDIEDRGFERDEIWYNRERSEQLFWQMMDEVNYQEDFHVDGPLWIQVHALEKGLEIVVTKAQLSKNGDNLEFPIDEDGSTIDIPVDEKVESFLEDKFGKSENENNELEENLIEENLWIIASFNDFEDVIQLSHHFQNDTGSEEETLYFYNGKYYLYMEFSQDVLDENTQEDIISRVFEYGDDSNITIHMLDEYGKKIIDTNTFTDIRTHFPANI
ncbi:adaptor protein MecA [Ornithinibacillus californiensis]|uniref:adaptor protein MecA n=1 Tax=Ornithinibacillus californiensis TaxID=161536 RepID=UPI00064DCC2A|nr:adaptor protein MecA [Ornithinibacillus californiensis]